MIVSFIAAVAENNAIGRNNELPWRLPGDLRFFKKVTLGKPVVMGSKTFVSLGRPLPGRLNIVLSRNKDLPVPEGVVVCTSIADCLKRMQEEPGGEGFIIGGGQLFEATMSAAERMYITRVHAAIADADAFFPAIDHTHWKMVWEEAHEADEHNQYAYTFEQYERIGF